MPKSQHGQHEPKPSPESAAGSVRSIGSLWSYTYSTVDRNLAGVPEALQPKANLKHPATKLTQ